MPKMLGRMLLVAAFVAGISAIAILSPSTIRFLAGGPAIYDATTLPSQIGICGRQWSVDAQRRAQSLAEIRAESGVEPVVVDLGLFAPCPSGPCTRVAGASPCDTVIFVRVGEDAYVDYSLQGGP